MSKILSDWKNIIIFFLLIISSFFYIKSCSVENQLNDNIIVISDSLYQYKNKINELYLEKESYITDIKNLKHINKDLYDEVKKLKDDPIVVTKILTETKIDSVKIESTKYVYIDNNLTNYYTYNNDYIKMDIVHSIDNNIGNLYINNISLYSNIYTSIIERDNKLYMISRSDNPYMNINNIDGCLLNINDSNIIKNYIKHNKTFFDNFNFSITGGISILYDFNKHNACWGPGFTMGISYNFN